MEKVVGSYSFIAGVALAVLLGLLSSQLGSDAVIWLTSLMVLLGLIVGFLNVSGKETMPFLTVAAILVFVSFVTKSAPLESLTVGSIGAYLDAIFTNVLAFVVPATVVVALKEVWYLARAP